MIPNTVSEGLISGVVGTLSHWGPIRARTAIIHSASEANNIFGRAFTFRDQTVETVQAGGDGYFAGIMINPLAHKIDNPLQNGSVSEFLDMGEIFAEVVGATESNIGAPVYFIPGTGVLTVTAEENTRVPNAVIERHKPSAETPNLVVIRLTN